MVFRIGLVESGWNGGRWGAIKGDKAFPFYKHLLAIVVLFVLQKNMQNTSANATMY